MSLTTSDPNSFPIKEAEVIYWVLCPDCSTSDTPERNAVLEEHPPINEANTENVESGGPGYRSHQMPRPER